MTTFFEGEIISKKYPFLTRKWDADEEVDKKHWVCYCVFDVNSPLVVDRIYNSNHSSQARLTFIL